MMNFLDSSYRRWICPSDRELTLRAKLRAGWSSRASLEPAGAGINEAEQAAITQVLERASRAEELEEERVRKLNDRLAKMKKQARGDGKRGCILCNDQPRFFARFCLCKDCQNAVCGKCSVDTLELDTGELVWLCKICSESRELLKKTNRWTELCCDASRPS